MNGFETLVSTDTENSKQVSTRFVSTSFASFPNNIFKLAEAFLSIAPMTHKKLQKLCYYAKAWYLALYNENIIPEDFQAWVHGAVNPELYKHYSVHGFEEIPKRESVADIPEEILSFAHEIYSVYGKYTGDELESINHQEAPWLNARKGLKPWESSNSIISEDDMKSYYRKRIL